MPKLRHEEFIVHTHVAPWEVQDLLNYYEENHYHLASMEPTQTEFWHYYTLTFERGLTAGIRERIRKMARWLK